MFENLLDDNTGTRIKSKREQLEISVQKLAHLSVTSKHNIEQIEKGKYEKLNFELLVRISKIIGLNVFSFIKSGVTVEELLKTI